MGSKHKERRMIDRYFTLNMMTTKKSNNNKKSLMYIYLFNYKLSFELF